MSVSAHIQKYRKTDDGHTEFFVKVFYKGREWAVNKRFSDFVKFDEYLKKHGYDLNCQLPQKTWWNRFDTNVLIQRQKDLQGYLDVMLKSTLSSENALVKEFLEVDNNMLTYAKKEQHRQSYLEKLHEIVSETRLAMIKIPISNNNTHITKRESISRNNDRKLSTSAKLASPLFKRSDSIDSSGAFGSYRDNSDRISTYSNSSSFVSEARAAVVEVARKEQFLNRINSNKVCRYKMAEMYSSLDRKTLPVVDHDIDDVEYILSIPDPISSILTSILENEVNSILEASPQTKIALVGSKIMRHFANSSSSNQHSNTDLLRATGRSNSTTSSMAGSPLSRNGSFISSLPLKIQTTSLTGNSDSNPNSIAGSPAVASSFTPRSRNGSSIGGGGADSPTKSLGTRKSTAEESKNLSFESLSDISANSRGVGTNLSRNEDISSSTNNNSSIDNNSNNNNNKSSSSDNNSRNNSSNSRPVLTRGKRADDSIPQQSSLVASVDG